MSIVKRTIFRSGIAAIVLSAMLVFSANRVKAQEQYGHTFNIGLGFAYFHYIGYSVPFVTANYEFDVARNFTLAPSIGIASYRSYDDYPYGGHYYYYHETVVPIAAKGTYYLDRLLNAGPRWDFYIAASLGFVWDRVVWDDGYHGGDVSDRSPLFIDGHIGAEYRIGRKTGLYLDLSTGVSTLGLAFHSGGYGHHTTHTNNEHREYR